MMRLICPECAARYDIADGLIPPEGRDVECSACGHAWRQPGLPPLRLSPEVAVADEDAEDAEVAQDAPQPLVSRGLTDPILAILREEAERELAARAAERTDMGDPRDGDIADAPPAAPAFRQPAGTDALPDPHALAASLQWEVPRRPEAEAIAPQLPEPEPVTPPRPLAVTVATAVAVRQRRAHDRGFATAMLVAVLLVGAYALAPGLAERGLAAAQVTGAREAVDSGRLWLQARAESLTDRAIGGVGGLFD